MPDPIDPPAPAPDPIDPPAPAVDDRTFTQADVDKIVQERLARAKTSAPPDYDDLKAKAAKFDEIEAANKSELEKLQEALAAEQNKASAASERARRAAVRAAVVAEAQRAGAVDPDAVLAMLPEDAVTIGDDDQVTGADAAVKALLEAKPYLVGKPTRPVPGSANGGPRGDQPAQWTREDLKNKSPDQIEAARKAGLLTDLMTS
jgi:hypothetical protein